MSEKWSERYIEKDMKVFDTWKGFPITRKLDRYSLTHMISHFNQLGEIIDDKIKQGQYYLKHHYDSKEELDYYKSKCASLEEGLIQKEREISMLKNTIGRTEAYIERLTHKSNWDNSAFDVSEERKTNKSTVSEIYQKENDEEIPNYNFKKINYRRKRII